MKSLIPFVSALLLTSTVVATAAASPLPDEAQLKALTARFVPVEIKADVSKLPANEQLALRKIVDAAKGELFVGGEFRNIRFDFDRDEASRERLELRFIRQGRRRGRGDDGAG